MNKKIVALLAVLVLCLGVVAGCSGKPAQETVSTLYKVGYSLSEEEKLTHFFMDREYALDSESMKVTQAELDKAGRFLTDYVLESAKNGGAWDVKIGGASVMEEIKDWTLKTEKTGEDDAKTDYTLTYTKAGEVLEIVIYATAYKAYPVVEWTIWLNNKGEENSAQITELNALDYTFAADCAESEVLVTTFEGSHEDYTSFKPDTRILEKMKTRIVSGTGGKSSVDWSPYMNLQWKNEQASWGKEGVFISNGWPGQWYTKATNTGEGTAVVAKQETLNTYLKAGESLRSPLITLLFWEKDLMRSQNIWRNWVYNVAMPQPNGEPIPAGLHGNTAQDTALTETATTENQVEAIRKWVELGLDVDGWQMDAGWYDIAPGYNNWVGTGSWEPSANRFGGSLKEISNVLHENSMKFILWYEPERLVADSEWYNKFHGTDWIIENPTWHCFNLANDKATDFLIEYLLKSIDENGVDIYRQDCNINGPSLRDYWKQIQEDGRKGYVENKYIRNYLRYYDAILEHTGTFIDSCASGGKRLDLETTKRAVALWRDDKCYEPLLTQCQSWGINFFMPYSGQGSLSQSSGSMKYSFRSNMMAWTGLPWKLSLINEKNIDLHKQMIQEHKDYAHYYTQEYYPLTAFSTDFEPWMAWQYNDASDSTGIIQVFKRPESRQREATYYLSGLQADTLYEVKDIDTGDTVQLLGKELMCNGITITLQDYNAAEIYSYRPVTQ